ncbi:MAG: ImmA/IrrE family metallo-endopeptidase [Oscillospiraceae bacterium]|nr:ImmA/IrrE family metallo-endopeptidase [Oscillospiraceae bacterium]
MTDGAAHARALAQSLLLNQNPPRLPVRVEKLRFDKRLIIDSLEHYCALTSHTLDSLTGEARAALQDGCTLIVERRGRRVYLILYNEKARSTRRRQFTLAHEVGHIYLGHGDDSPASEREANSFAAELLVPRVLACEYLKTAKSVGNPALALSQAFGASYETANICLSGFGRDLDFTQREKDLLARYRPALPDPREPEVSY